MHLCVSNTSPLQNKRSRARPREEQGEASRNPNNNNNDNTLIKHETGHVVKAPAKGVSSTDLRRGQSSACVPLCFPPRLSRLPCLQPLSQDGQLMAR